MPRPKDYPYWRERVKAVLSEYDGKISDRKVLQRLRAEAEGFKNSGDPKRRQVADYLPSERTISRIRTKEWEPLTPPERAQYRYFYWPESMERGDILWEASAHCMELLGYLFHSSRAEEYGRPTIRQAKWFWRVSMAIPDLELDKREFLARLFAIWEAARGEVEEAARSVEGYLAFAPWRSPENKQEYNKAIAEKTIPAIPEDLGPVHSEKLYAVFEELGIARRDKLAAVAEVEAWLGTDKGKTAIEKFAAAVGEAAARLRAEEQQNPAAHEKFVAALGEAAAQFRAEEQQNPVSKEDTGG